jgi:hypothetical protein
VSTNWAATNAQSYKAAREAANAVQRARKKTIEPRSQQQWANPSAMIPPMCAAAIDGSSKQMKGG